MDGLNWTKILALVIVNVGTTLLTAMGSVQAEATIAIYGASLGYVFGNGHGLAEAQRYVASKVNSGNGAAK